MPSSRLCFNLSVTALLENKCITPLQQLTAKGSDNHPVVTHIPHSNQMVLRITQCRGSHCSSTLLRGLLSMLLVHWWWLAGIARLGLGFKRGRVGVDDQTTNMTLNSPGKECLVSWCFQGVWKVHGGSSRIQAAILVILRVAEWRLQRWGGARNTGAQIASVPC